MKVLLLAIAFFVAITTYGQQGSITDLDTKYGFKEIRFGESVKTKSKFAYIGKGETESDYYSANVSSMKIGDSPIKEVHVSAVSGMVGYIFVSFDNKYGEKIKEVLEHAYGPATEKPEKNKNIFNWLGEKVNMSISFVPGKDGSITLVSKDAQLLKSIDKTIKLNKDKEDL